jgi:hypothetical protein
MQGEREGDLSSSPNRLPAACSKPLPLSQGKISQLHAADPLPLPEKKTETDQLHTDLLGCYVRRELEGRRSDRKHGGSWSLDLPPEPAAAMAAAHTSLFQAKNRTQPACMLLSLSVE